MSDLKSRLIKYIEYKGITKAEFERSAKLSNGFVDKSGDNTRRSSLDKISIFYNDLNIDWILTGKGEMLITDKISELFQDVSQKKETNFVAENEAAYEAKKMDPCHIIIDTLTRSNAMLIETNAKQQEEIHRLVNMIEGKKKNGLNGGAQNAGDVAV